MVVHASLTVFGHDLGEVLSRIAIGIEAHIELALAVSIAVVVDILVVEGNLHVLAEVEIEGSAEKLSGTAKDSILGRTAFKVVQVQELILESQFHVAP